jgi:ABC-type branched-subunit amino acid transport system substrate-binding protein
MKRLFWLLLVVVLTIGPILSACSQTATTSVSNPVSSSPANSPTALPSSSASSPATLSSSVPPSASPQKVLKIGAVVPMQMAEGLEMQKWVNLFAEIYNKNGGWKVGNDVYQIQFIVEDGGFMEAAKSRAAVEKLVLQDGVKYLVPCFGDIAPQTATITEPNKVLWIGCDFTPQTAMPGFKYFIRGSSINFICGMNYVYQKELLDNGAKTYLTLGADETRSKVLVENMNKTANMVGLQVIPSLYFAQDTVDFSPIATKIKSLNPDALDLGTVSGDQGLNLLSAIKDVNYKGIISPGNMTQSTLDNAVKKLGKDYVEGMKTAGTDPRGVQDDPAMLELIEKYTQKYGEFHSDGCLWITPWFYFQDAVNSTQSVDVSVLADYLHNSKHAVMTMMGYSQLFARPDVGNFQTMEAVTTNIIETVKDGKLVATQIVSVQDQLLVSIKVLGLVDAYQKYWDQYGKPEFPPQKSLFDFADLTK